MTSFDLGAVGDAIPPELKMALISVLLAMHLLAAVFWVGGMAFAYMVLRPAAGALVAQVRLPLWQRVFARFLPLVAVSIAALLASGFAMVFLVFGGFAGAPLYVHVMTGTGIVMMLLYLHLVFAPWRRFRAAVDADVLGEAGKRLNQIRRIVGVNLVLGALTIIVGGAGRYW